MLYAGNVCREWAWVAAGAVEVVLQVAPCWSRLLPLFLVPSLFLLILYTSSQQGLAESLACESRYSVTSGGKYARKSVVLMEERERRENRKNYRCIELPIHSLHFKAGQNILLFSMHFLNLCLKSIWNFVMRFYMLHEHRMLF